MGARTAHRPSSVILLLLCPREAVQKPYLRGRRGAPMSKLGQRAVVCGASMAGLLAARVLSDFYETVTLVERDRLPDGAEQRRGVPQGRHFHALLSTGSKALGELFP